MSFVYAISSAGVVHAVTRGCSSGKLTECACDPSKQGRKGRDEKGEFEWGGCSDYVRYGAKFSRWFVDAREKKVKDARALMNLHNNRAGRRVRKCTCIPFGNKNLREINFFDVLVLLRYDIS